MALMRPALSLLLDDRRQAASQQTRFDRLVPGTNRDLAMSFARDCHHDGRIEASTSTKLDFLRIDRAFRAAA